MNLELNLPLRSPAKIISILAVILPALFLVSLATATNTLLIAVAGLGVLLILVKIYLSPFWGTQLVFITLPIMIPIVGNRFGGEAFFNIRLYQVVALATFSALLMWVFTRKAAWPPMRLSLPFALLLGTYLLSFRNTEYFDDSVRALVKILAAQVVLFIVIVAMIQEKHQLQRVIKLLAWTGIVVAWIGYVQAISYQYFGINLSVVPINPTPTALFTEAGWYGFYGTILFALFLPMMFLPSAKAQRGLLVVSIVHCAVAALLSENRSSVLGILLALILVALVGPILWQISIGSRLRILVVVSSVVLFGFLMASYLFPDLVQGLGWKFSRISFGDPRKEERVIRLNDTLEYVAQHPIIGNGVGTYGAKVLPRGIRVFGLHESVLVAGSYMRGGGSFNIFLGALYDAGVLGLVALIWLLLAYVMLLRRAIQKCQDEWIRALLIGCLLAFAVIIFISQFSPLYLSDYAWAFVALGVAVCNIATKQPGGLEKAENHIRSVRPGR